MENYFKDLKNALNNVQAYVCSLYDSFDDFCGSYKIKILNGKIYFEDFHYHISKEQGGWATASDMDCEWDSIFYDITFSISTNMEDALNGKSLLLSGFEYSIVLEATD